MFDIPQVYQVLGVIKSAGSGGLSLVEMQSVLGLPRLTVRRILNILDRGDYVTTVMQDQGRQKVIRLLEKKKYELRNILSAISLVISLFYFFFYFNFNITNNTNITYKTNLKSLKMLNLCNENASLNNL